MSWFEWAAILGALAWLPQIIRLIYYYTAKPKLIFSPGSTIEVGYSLYGPILNPSFAISTSRKDALLEKIELNVIHQQSEEKHTFEWQVLDEKGFETQSQTGERIESRKSQRAIALKISILFLIERTIGFQDILFIEKKLSFDNVLSEKEEHLLKTDPLELPKSLFKTKGFTDTLDFIKNGFYWKEGKYEVHLYAYVPSMKNPLVEKYTFTLSKINVDMIEKNIKLARDFLKNFYSIKYNKLDKHPEYLWAWVYPSFKRLES